jgi:large subunit ribosomal protein L28
LFSLKIAEFRRLTSRQRHLARVPEVAILKIGGNFFLTGGRGRAKLPALKLKDQFMSKVCSITHAKVSKGSAIHRRGMAKKKGGVGRHVTANTPRKFTPNLKTRRIWVSELKKFITVKLTARAIKTVTKNGAYATLKKAGII